MVNWLTSLLLTKTAKFSQSLFLCQQRTLTPPDTWPCPTLGLACVLQTFEFRTSLGTSLFLCPEYHLEVIMSAINIKKINHNVLFGHNLCYVCFVVSS